MRLRPVEAGDIDAYVAMRCDPVMMADLGGPQPVADMPGKVARDAASVAADHDWLYLILDALPGSPEQVAGTVTLYAHGEVSEIGWMVLPAFQGRGLAKAATAELLRRAAADGRWGSVHAWPAVANGPSNGICRSLGFEFVGQEEICFAGQTFTTNHWRWDPDEAA